MRDLYITMLISCMLAFGSCQNSPRKNENDRMDEKFEWSPAAGSAYLYPMETYRCNFIFGDSSIIGPDTRVVSTEWGADGGTSAVGDALKPVPVALDICWLSYTENKFYQGRFKLPYTHILRQFKQGFNDYTWTSDTKRHLTHHTYDNITAGMAPGGVVVLWLNGSGVQVEAGRFRAKETTVDMAKFLDREDVKISQSDYVKDELSRLPKVTTYLLKKGITYGIWDKYRERFRFRPVIQYDEGTPIKLSDMSLEYFNGEKDHFLEYEIPKIHFMPKARVKGLRAVWVASDTGKEAGYVLDIQFDEEEIFKAYQVVCGRIPKQPAELVVEINKKNNSFQVILRGSGKKIELQQQSGEINNDDSVKN